jgi:hypothetical protein
MINWFLYPVTIHDLAAKKLTEYLTYNSISLAYVEHACFDCTLLNVTKNKAYYIKTKDCFFPYKMRQMFSDISLIV